MSLIVVGVAGTLVFAVALLHYRATAPRRNMTDMPTERPSFESFWRSLSAATWYGAIVGALIGGIGGRIAMRILFLTSPDKVKGVESDDGFIIGRFDAVSTLNLVLFGALIGLAGGLMYLTIRKWLPDQTRQRSATVASGAAMVVGSAIIHAEGVDFTLLSPRRLSVALFIFIPAAFGWFIVPTVDSAEKPDSWFQRKRLKIALLPLLLLLFPLAAIALVIPLAITLIARWIARSKPSVVAVWESRQLLWAGRLVIVAIGVVATVALINDLRAVL